MASLSVSPSGKALLLVTRVDAEKALETEVPQFVTKSGYVEDAESRGKVGDVHDSGRVALVSLPSGQARWLQVIPDDTTNAPAMVEVLGWNDAGTQVNCAPCASSPMRMPCR